MKIKLKSQNHERICGRPRRNRGAQVHGAQRDNGNNQSHRIQNFLQIRFIKENVKRMYVKICPACTEHDKLGCYALKFPGRL